MAAKIEASEPEPTKRASSIATLSLRTASSPKTTSRRFRVQRKPRAENELRLYAEDRADSGRYGRRTGRAVRMPGCLLRASTDARVYRADFGVRRNLFWRTAPARHISRGNLNVLLKESARGRAEGSRPSKGNDCYIRSLGLLTVAGSHSGLLCVVPQHADASPAFAR